VIRRWPTCAGSAVYAARFAIFAMVARLHPVQFLSVPQDLTALAEHCPTQ
jgi:hypothetical protein